MSDDMNDEKRMSPGLRRLRAAPNAAAIRAAVVSDHEQARATALERIRKTAANFTRRRPRRIRHESEE